MDAGAAMAFEKLLVSPRFLEDLCDITKNDPEGATRVAKTVCGLLVDMGNIDRRRIRGTNLKLYRSKPPGAYRSVDRPLGQGVTALLRAIHRKDVYDWVSRYEGEPTDSFLPVRASPLLRQQVDAALNGDEDAEVQPTVSDPVPRKEPDDPVRLSGGDDLLTIARRGMEEYLTTLSEEQRTMVGRLSRGPAVIRGPAGSGKTIMALHLVRQMHEELQRNLLTKDERILLLDFGRTLRENLRSMLSYLCGEIPGCVQIINIHRWCENYLVPRSNQWRTGIPARDRSVSAAGSIRHAIRLCRQEGLLGDIDDELVFDEITSFMIRRGFRSLDEYLEADRTGRGYPLRSEAREQIWGVYERREEIQRHGFRAWGYDDLINLTLEQLAEDEEFRPYRYVVVDEVQDFSVAMLRLARRLAGDDESRLFMFGDAAQSLYDPSFRWKDAELAVRGGRVRTLSSSHRCAKRIYQAARIVIHPLAADRPEDYDEPDQYTHVGTKPRVVFVPDEESQVLLVTEEIQGLLESEALPQTIAVLSAKNQDLIAFSRRLAEMDVVSEYFRDNEDSRIKFEEPAVKLVTIHSAKGLGFPHVFLMVPPPVPERWDEERERKTLFTAMTRAGVSLVLLTPEHDPHPLMQELVSSGYAVPEYPG